MFYKKGVDICSAKSMFNFLNEHFTYYTLNSWNGLESIANNVKLYNLHLDGDWCNALAYLFDEQDIGGLQYELSSLIREFERLHSGYVVGFNGRSGGYLVLYNEHNAKTILPENISGFDNYEDFKDNLKTWYCWRVKDYLPELREYTKLVQDFDRLCDDMRNLVNEYSLMDYEADRQAYESEEC